MASYFSIYNSIYILSDMHQILDLRSTLYAYFENTAHEIPRQLFLILMRYANVWRDKYERLLLLYELDGVRNMR